MLQACADLLASVFLRSPAPPDWALAQHDGPAGPSTGEGDGPSGLVDWLQALGQVAQRMDRVLALQVRRACHHTV